MPVVKLQAIPVSLGCTDSPQFPGRGAEPARAWMFKVALSYPIALLPASASAVPRCADRTFPFLGHCDTTWASLGIFILFSENSAVGWSRARKWDQSPLGGWRTNLHFYFSPCQLVYHCSTHTVWGGPVQCASNSYLSHQRSCAP